MNMINSYNKNTSYNKYNFYNKYNSYKEYDIKQLPGLNKDMVGYLNVYSIPPILHGFWDEAEIA